MRSAFLPCRFCRQRQRQASVGIGMAEFHQLGNCFCKFDGFRAGHGRSAAGVLQKEWAHATHAIVVPGLVLNTVKLLQAACLEPIEASRRVFGCCAKVQGESS